MPSCVAYGCSNRMTGKSKRQKLEEETQKVTFHRFPKCPEKRKTWIQAVRRDKWSPSPRSVICSTHFEEKFFDRTSLVYVRLRDNAVPTIFKSFPTYMQKKNTIRRKPKERISAEFIERPSTSHETGDLNQVSASVNEADFEIENISLMNRSTQNTTRGTDISPQRFRSPIKELLRKKIEQQKLKYRQKIRVLQNARLRHKKKIASLQNVISTLRNKNLLLEENLNILSSISGPNKEILKRQLYKSSKKPVTRMYSPELRTFALTLHYYSPKAYNFVRSEFNSCLPHPKTLSKWYATVNGEPGFTKESFNAVRFKANNAAHDHGHGLYCSLILDEMAIRQLVEYDGKQFQGYVDMGTGVDSDCRDVAKEVLVFMLVCINGAWKVPVGFFLLNGITAEQKSNLVNICVQMAHEAGVRVVSLTFDGLQSNFSMAKLLGCNLEEFPMKTWFTHFTTNEKIYIFPDPCHMLKLVINTLGDKKEIFDAKGVVSWIHIVDLHNIQEKEGLHLGNKLKSDHIYYQKQKMKVRLAAQLFSNSVADALEFIMKEFGPNCENYTSTIYFIKLFNKLFDIFNSRNLLQFGYKKALYPKNKDVIFEFFEEAENYINSLNCTKYGQPILQSNRKTGFKGFLICISSLKSLYEDLINIENPKLLYIPCYKLSQDHLEMFFGVIRSHGGHNNNPTVRQFKSAYKKVLIHTELRSTGTGNCIALEEISILHASSNASHSENIINNSSEKSRMLEVNIEIHPELFDHDYLPSPDRITDFTVKIIGYIAGFVLRHLKKKINCEHCLSALEGDDSDVANSLVSIKNRGGLSFASENLIRVCEECEKIVRCALKQSGGKFMLKKYSTLVLVNKVLSTFISKTIFDCLNNHCYDQSPLDNHRMHLIRAIAHKYFDIRLRYIGKRAIDKSESNRQHFNKLILFKGQ